MIRKCARTGCLNAGTLQPLIRIRASVLPAYGSDILAVIRLPFTACPKCRAQTSASEIIGMIPKDKMQAAIREAYKRTGSSPNPDRTDVHWVRILGNQGNG